MKSYDEHVTNYNETIYVVYRVYSARERPNPSDRARFYGWSTAKSIVKALLEQRSKGKYVYKKLDTADKKYFPEIDDPNYMIDYMCLKCARTREEIKFFTTLTESKEAELNIQSKFHLMSSIEDIDILKMFVNLDPYYRDALEFLGFRPKEIDDIYDSSDLRDSYNSMALVENEIEDAYMGAAMCPSEDDLYHFMNPPGLLMISKVWDKILYSVENFITVLRDDL